MCSNAKDVYTSNSFSLQLYPSRLSTRLPAPHTHTTVLKGFPNKIAVLQALIQSSPLRLVCWIRQFIANRDTNGYTDVPCPIVSSTHA